MPQKITNFLLYTTLILGLNSCGGGGSEEITYLPPLPEPEPEVYKSIHVNSYMTDDQEAPKVALTDNGNFFIIWRSQDGAEEGKYNIYAQLFDKKGDKIGYEFRVNNEVNSKNAHDASQLHYDVTSNHLGSFVVVYSTDGATEGSNVFIQYYNDEDATPMMMIQANQGDMEMNMPSVAIDSNNNGDIIITYQSEIDSVVGHKYSLFNPYFELLYTGWIDTRARNYSLDIALNDDQTFISGWNTSSLTDHVNMAKLSADGKILNSYSAPSKTDTNNVQVDIGYDGSVLWLYNLKVDSHWVITGKIFDKTMNQSKDFIDNSAISDFEEKFSAVVDNNNSLYITHVLSSYANATAPNADNTDVYYRIYNYTQDITLVADYGIINIEKLYDQKLPSITVNSTGIVATWQNSAENNKNSDGIYAGILSNL